MTSLEVPSPWWRFDKLATLDRAILAGKIGDAAADWLDSHRTTFFAVLGSVTRPAGVGLPLQ